jgi:bifunctional DNA-binding transcriptional regulator/antitoxin component of YhaV-PrlF toxin-antitoxin module
VKVGPEDPVVTIKGFCTDDSLKGDACKTAITKTQFDKLAESLQPNMSPAMRRQLATAYARMLTMSTEAEKRGLDKTPHFEEASHFARMQILSQELGRNLQTESGNVSDQDIKDYYQKNAANYEQATFVRIFVPHSKRAVTPAPAKKTAGAAKTAAPAAAKAKTLSPEEQEKAGVEAMKKEADLLRARLAKGEDPDKLEKAAFVAAGLPGNPSPTKMEKVRRTTLPPDHQSAMNLKPGDISEVISDPSGNYIYKMVSKETMPVDSVKTEIKNAISSQRFRDAMQKFQGNAELNDAYFGPVRGPGMPMPPHGAKPPAKAEEDDDRD